MALLNVNPEAEVSAGFEAVQPGPYRVRIKADGVVDRNTTESGKNDLEVTFEHVLTPAELVNTAGQPLKGQPGMLRDYIMLAADKQWKLRGLTEACGLPWEDYDPIADLPGREVDVIIKNEPYEGEMRNKIARYVVVQ